MADVAAEERALIERCQTGDLEAFDRLVEQHGRRVYQLAFRLIGNSHDAEDAAQECLLRAFSAMKSFRGTSSFSTWLYRIALNVCRDEIKRRARRPYAASSLATDDQPDPLAAIPSDEPGPDEVAETHERRRLVQEAIARLPEHHRTPLVLRDLEGLSYEQIGEVLGAAVGTVKSRINRARLALKAELAPHMELFR